MKTLNLFLKMHFTSLSPDGQCISLAIISECFEKLVPIGEKREFKTNTGTLISVQHEMEDEDFMMKDFISSKSFYAEFQDFDINRCDDFVKDNVLKKTNILAEYNRFNNAIKSVKEKVTTNLMFTPPNENFATGWGDSEHIKKYLTNWLSQFSDYKLNFIVDCGWFTWYKFVELMGEWEEKGQMWVPKDSNDKLIRQLVNNDIFINYNKIGLPKLPANFPPAPTDINELIAFKRGITVSEAFELDRELEFIGSKGVEVSNQPEFWGRNGKYNALWDCKVTKAIYEKLK